MLSQRSLVDFLVELKTHTIGHSGAQLLLHLLGTQSILGTWGATPALCRAGLFHSVYGTHSFRTAVLSTAPRNRARVRRKIGRRSEEVVYYYSVLNYRSVTTALQAAGTGVVPRTPLSVSTRAGSTAVVKTDTLISILNLIIANEAEQYARASWAVSEFILSLSAKQLAAVLPEARSFVRCIKQGSR